MFRYIFKLIKKNVQILELKPLFVLISEYFPIIAEAFFDGLSYQESLKTMEKEHGPPLNFLDEEALVKNKRGSMDLYSAADTRISIDRCFKDLY